MEKYIETWNQAIIDPSRMDTTYRADDMMPQLAKLEKSQQVVLRNKTLASMVALLALLIIFLNKMEFTPLTLVGITIFISSVLSVIVLLNRLRFRITPEERSLSPMQLVKLAERKILTERRIFTRYLPLFLLVAIAGFNLMYVDFFSGDETITRLKYHLIMTGGLIAAFAFGITIRIKRFQRQFLPLLDRIRQFKQESR